MNFETSFLSPRIQKVGTSSQNSHQNQSKLKSNVHTDAFLNIKSVSFEGEFFGKICEKIKKKFRNIFKFYNF